MNLRRLALPVIGSCLLSAPVLARDSLGVFGQWGAFRDPQVPRCYAIAQAEGSASAAGFATVSHWPDRQVRGQVHIRLSRAIAGQDGARLVVSGERFQLAGQGRDVFAADRQMDARIVAAMRSAGSMTVSGRDRQGRLFTDRYVLAGAATAIDAATVGCARSG
ncbi:hypothetical protein ACFODK_09715 [Altererythrobacter lauratis]|uniref:Mlr4354 like protein n=1 Tax=Alteraurantiacibacter lauratis TaxID=2054627 RepID=A0ABV7EGT1_9SPHN